MGVVLSLLVVFGPISMDLYLPLLPSLTTELQPAPSTAQLTLTACVESPLPNACHPTPT